MKRHGLVVIVLVALLAAGCSSLGAKTAPTPAAPAAPIPAVVSASGKLMPLRWANLSMQSSGRIAKVLVQTGDMVQAGQVLVQLDDADARLALAQANAGLQTARAQLAQLKAGPRPAEVASAEQGVKEAEASVASAAAQLAQLLAGTRPADIAAAQAQVAQAEAELKVSQDNYDAITTGRGIAKEYNIRGGGLGLYEEQARVQLAATRAGAEAAKQRLAQLQAGATKSELDGARANLAAAQARKDRAQAQLDLLKAGASPEQIAVSEAGVAQAQAAADVAQAAIDKLSLKASFAGTVGNITVREGEMLTPGQPALSLGDLSNLRVETTDLSEADIARVTEGQPVNLTFDALPGKTLAGRVARISPVSSAGQGGVNYTVIVELKELDPALRWGMTAFADIQVSTVQ